MFRSSMIALGFLVMALAGCQKRGTTASSRLIVPQITSCNARTANVAGGVIERSSNKQLLVFVHGWNGDAESTWKRFPELVCTDPYFARTDVLSINYPTFIVSRNATVVETANSITDQLAAIGIKRYKRLAIISHSMGGLITREMLIAESMRSPKNIAKYKILVEIATPHEGTTDLTGLANALGFPGTDLVSALLPGSELIRDLAVQWNNFSTRPPTSCFFSGQDAIVPASSARSQCGAFHDFLDGGHTELAKPEGLNDVRYTLPMQAIKEAFSQNAQRSQTKGASGP